VTTTVKLQVVFAGIVAVVTPKVLPAPAALSEPVQPAPVTAAFGLAAFAIPAG